MRDSRSRKQQSQVEPRRLDAPCTLSTYSSLEEWEARAAELRRQILASAGLLPLPRTSPLRAKVFGRFAANGYSVEKVHFESRPGFLVTGNLYRPTSGDGPWPGVLSPHGHWEYGRLEATDLCDIPRRCIDFARQGYVAFAYDMIGYNDSLQLPHGRVSGGGRAGVPPPEAELADRLDQMWGISLMGLQLWNTIRAVDFLSSLPDVDPTRIACTGASGGGTQTFLATAVDERITVSAPVCMISAHYQGGCLCENGPALRLDTNNLEIGALAAPRPLLLISTSGDWTTNGPEVEYPWIRDIYRLYGAEERVASWHQDETHNYNLESRRAVYQWFSRWLGRSRNWERFRERGFGHDPRPGAPDLLVFYGRTPPKGLPTRAQLRRAMIRETSDQLAERWPKTKAALSRFRRRYGPLFQRALAALPPASEELAVVEHGRSETRTAQLLKLTIGRKGRSDRIPALLMAPRTAAPPGPAVLLVHPEGTSRIAADRGRRLHPVAAKLLKSGCAVLSIDCFGTGDAPGYTAETPPHFTTYNRTDVANRVQDILTGLAYLSSRPHAAAAALVGLGEAGLWCLLARGLSPEIAACAADIAKLDLSDDEAVAGRLFVPLLRKAGDLRTAAALAAPGPLFVHNTGDRFPTSWLTRLYSAAGSPAALQVSRAKASPGDISQFIIRHLAMPRRRPRRRPRSGRLRTGA